MVAPVDVFRALESHPDPAVAAPELEDRLPVGRRSILGHLRSLERGGTVASKKVGSRARVWWPEDRSSNGPLPGAEPAGAAGRSRDRLRDLADLLGAQSYDENVLDTLADILYVLNADGKFLAWNDRAVVVSGYSDEEIADMDPLEFIRPDDRAGIAEAISSVVNEGRVETAETALVTKAGEHIPYEFNGAPLRDDTGEIWGLVGIGRDISEQKERERTLERQRIELEELNRINAIIRDVDEALVRATSREAIEEAVCDHLTDADPYEFAWLGAYDVVAGRVEPRAWAGTERGYLEDRPGATDDEEAITAETAVRTGEIQVAQNIAENDAFASWRDPALERGYRSAVAIPLRYREATHGVLCIYAARPNAFDDRECRVLDEMGHTIAYAISAVQRQEALVTDSVVELEFAIESPDAPLAELSGTATCELTLDGLISREDEPATAFVTATGATPEEISDGARTTDGAADIVTENEDTLLVRFETDSLLPFDVAEHGGIVRDAVAEHGEARFTVEFPQSVDIRTTVDALRQRADSFDLVAQHERERPSTTGAEFRSDLEDRLTERQHEVLETAFLAGFFDQPRRSSGEDVADTFDISASTFHEHVRTAERKLFATYFD